MNSGICWIAHERYSESAEVNLICFSYVGGSSTYFSPLKPKIDARINVLPVLYPGREKNMKKPGFDTVFETAKVFAEESAHLFEKDFAMLGHCTGALLAYETALEVQKLYGKKPVAFFASSSPAPSCRQFWPPGDLADEELTKYLLDRKMVDEAFVKTDVYFSYYLPLIKKDLDLFTKYKPIPPYQKIDAPVSVLRGDSDVLFEDAKAVNEWNDFTSMGITETVYTGGHFYLDQHRAEVGKFITDILLKK